MNQNPSDDLKQWYQGKTVLMTGATAGIGREMAKILARWESRVIVCGRNEEALESLKAELKEEGKAILDAYLFDLKDIGKVKELCQCVQNHYQVDILINNAAFGHMGDFSLIPEDKALAMLKVNIDAVVYLCRSFLPLMKTRPGCGVLNVGSVVSFYTVPGSALYSGTKHFILGLTDALHQEMAPYGVHVTGVYPGRTQSEFLLRATDGLQKRWSKADEPEDVAFIGLKGLKENKVRVLTDWQNVAKVFLARLLPIKMFLKKADAYRVVPQETQRDT